MGVYVQGVVIFNGCDIAHLSIAVAELFSQSQNICLRLLHHCQSFVKLVSSLFVTEREMDTHVCMCMCVCVRVCVRRVNHPEIQEREKRERVE